MKQNPSYLYCIIAIFLFSTNELVGKMIDSSISPLAITCYRFFIGSLLLSIFGFKNRITFKSADIIKISLIGILNVCISMYFLQLGIFYSQANIAAIIISSNPIFVSIFAALILKERFQIKTILCLLLGLLGLSFVIFGQFTLYEASKNLVLGIVYCLLASVTFALYTVLSKKEIEKSNSVFFNTVSFMAGAICLFIFGMLTKQDMVLPLDRFNLLGLLYLGVFVTGIAYITFFRGLKNINAATGSSFFLLKPIFASVLAFLLLKERLSIVQIVGVGIVMISLFLLNFKNGK